jgi:meiotically up-regulated gene 157 (Mug157) protein
MSIIMEGLTNNSQENLDYVWKRLEISHAGTFAMHESFNVNNPKEFTRTWFDTSSYIDFIYRYILF